MFDSTDLFDDKNMNAVLSHIVNLATFVARDEKYKIIIVVGEKKKLKKNIKFCLDIKVQNWLMSNMIAVYLVKLWFVLETIYYLSLIHI